MKCNFLVFFLYLFTSIFGYSQINENHKINSDLLNFDGSRLKDPSGHSSKITGGNKLSPVAPSNLEGSSVSALELMKQKGKVEDVSKRDAFAKHFPNEDGSYTAVITAGPVHYQKNGKWEDIETKIIRSSDKNYPYQNTTNLMETHFGKTLNDGIISKTEKGEVKEFLNTQMYWEVNNQKIGLQVGANVVGVSKENKFYYPNLFSGIDAEFIIESGKRKLNYIIPSQNVLGSKPLGANFLVFSEEIILPTGWSYEISEKKDLLIKNTKQELAFVYPKPEIFEGYETNDFIEEGSDNPTSFEINQVGNKLTYLLKVKADWLFEQERVYPIAVDPSYYPDQANYWTGYATSGGTGGNIEMRVGYNNFDYEILGFAKFNLSSIPDGSIIGTSSFTCNNYGRQGTLTNRSFRIVDVPLDVVPTSYFEIFNSPNFYVSDQQMTWPNNNNYTITFDLNEIGMSYVQNGFLQDHISIGLYINSFWDINNYARFQGYGSPTNPNRPYLTIDYTTTCTTPSSSADTHYISNVKFVGTLNPDTDRTSIYSTGGYANYTGDMPKGKQIPGGVVNINVTNNENIFTKAWVDWNKDGAFDSSEKIYDSGSIYVPSTTFGFVVPVGTAPGFYTVRIRTNRETTYYRACGPMGNGETEDYSFEVIADCPAKITAVNTDPSHGHRCGPGTVTLSASGTGTSYRWYTTQFGGLPIPGANTATYTTPSLSSTTTYYVTAYNGSCESVKRIPVVAKIDPIPTIDFTLSEPEICGEDASVVVSSSGDVEEYTLLMEEFNSGLGAFQHQYAGNTDPNAAWMNQSSPFKPGIPPYYVFSPAIASGYSGGNFACAVTDVQQASNILNRLVTTGTYDASELLTLNVDFDLYYASFGTLNPLYEYFAVEASADGGANWQTITTILTPQGNPSNWSKQSISLNSTYLVPNLKIRFVIFAYGDSSVGWVGDAAGIDNVRIYGDRPLDSNFDWAGDPGILYNENCIDPYTGAAPTVCIKPTDFELNETWTINATAILSNGCSASGSVEIDNNNKVWNTDASDWATLNWKPGTAVPTADNCVIIRTPVAVPDLTNGLAKTLKVETGGSLTIQSGGSLTVTDFITNEGAATDFVVESDANLVQINDDAINSGSIVAERLITSIHSTVAQRDYVYWSSPVTGQELKSFSPGTPNNRYFEYDEATDYFTSVNPFTDFVSGKGYAIRAENGLDGQNKTYTFTGTPNNGNVNHNIQIVKTGQGYNLIGNPYPSNINAEDLFDANSSIYTSVFFWSNNNYDFPTQQGSDYNGSNYSVYNGTGGNPATYNEDETMEIPDGTIKVGQGFIVQKIANGTSTLNFDNGMRVTTPGTFYEKTMKDRFWLTLTTPSHLVNTTLIGYIPGAVDAYDPNFDAEHLGGSDAIYTLLGTQQLGIQGLEPPLVKSDVIPLGVRNYEHGKHKISLYGKEGIFKENQKIYLKDKYLDEIHDFSNGSYLFESNSGEYNDRFEIIFKYDSPSVPVLTTASQVNIQKIDHQIQISSTLDKLMEVEILNLAGWSVYKNTNVNSLEIKIPAQQFDKEIIVIKVRTETGDVLTKKMINK